jgi:hypothetical protein
MRKNILFLIVPVSFVLLSSLESAPTPRPTPIKGSGKKAAAGPSNFPAKQNAYKKTYGHKDVTQVATPPPIPKQNVYKKHQTYGPKDVLQLATATPSPKKGAYVKHKTDVEMRPPPTMELEKVPYPGFHGKVPTPIPPQLSKGGKGKGKGKANAHVWINIDVYPPPPSEFGPPITVPTIPVYRTVPPSKVNFVPGGVAPVPEDYSPPPQNAPVEISPTALRGWNGQEELPGRAFDQTLVKLAAASDGTASWQFFWKTTGPEAQAARWEVATVPFVDDSTEFPPAGLVGYGDASINADSPLTENFFAVDFSGFAKNFEEGLVPNKYYMRVVPVDSEGNPIGKSSNFVRVDLP